MLPNFSALTIDFGYTYQTKEKLEALGILGCCQCSVCFHDFEDVDNRMLEVFLCDHVLCKSCFAKLPTPKTCPVCRLDLNVSPLQYRSDRSEKITDIVQSQRAYLRESVNINASGTAPLFVAAASGNVFEVDN